ncbi:phosphotransferase [Pseudomonas baetica]|uniref:phosphotransferase n=1 Tax=Pseudomonas baetica TaxID=674054 RepID=UPI003EEF70D2
MTKTLNIPALQSYLSGQGLAADGLIAVPLTGGQSNPTFCLETKTRKYVLRKRPEGKLLPGAHAVDREYRVMRALGETSIPVPEMLAFCEDESILGAQFYLMEFLAGRVITDQSLPGMSAHERVAIYREMNSLIARLHAVDYRAIGLETYGVAGNYIERQVRRWSRQCSEATVPITADMRRLMDWLPEHVPADDETTLVHGDFRLDNLVLHPTEPKAIGILDWELSTLGDPLADFSYHCMGWHIPPTLWRGIAGLNLAKLGIPDESDYVRKYVLATGRQRALEHWDFYMAFNLFRMAAILHGIAQRAADGTAAAKDATQTGAKAGPLAAIAWQCALRYEASRK